MASNRSISSSEPQPPERSKSRVVRADPTLGIALLPELYVKRKAGHQFNVMLLGQTGVGKTTLIDTLFRLVFKDNSSRDHCSPKVEVIAELYDLNECGVDLRLGVIETRGFGDQMLVGVEESYKSIVEYIDSQFERRLDTESQLTRSGEAMDTCVHLCLYLISPVGHGLKAIDLLAMRALDKRVNLVPVIAKSDLINKSDLSELKVRIMSEIETNWINIYRFPTDDRSTAEFNAKLNSLLPLASVASNEFFTIDDRVCRARQHPWGTIEVDNEQHSDLSHLRNGIMKNMADLMEKTEDYYERYREGKMVEIQMMQDQLVQLRALHKRQENQLIATFTDRLKIKDDELKKKEKALHNMFEEMSKERIGEKMRLSAMQKELDEDIARLDQKRRLAFNVEVASNQCPQTASKASNKRKLLRN